MQWFTDLKLRTKLLVSFGAVLALIVALGVFAADRLSAVNQQVVDLGTSSLPSIRLVE